MASVHRELVEPLEGDNETVDEVCYYLWLLESAARRWQLETANLAGLVSLHDIAEAELPKTPVDET